MIGNCIIAQSGGPTAVINASLYGAVMEAFKHEEIEKVYGAQNGILGVLNQELFDFGKEDIEELELLKTSPSSALGSCRYRLQNEDDMKKIFKIFKAHNIRYFFYTGGNDSMDTADKLYKYANQINYDMKIMGIVKTIDNDLPHTDHCPGFGSAAKYIASSVLEVAKDAEIYKQNIITVVEVMGRNAGWLAASSALSKLNSNLGPDLIYLPEVPFSIQTFLEDVKKIYEKSGKVLIVVSEGIKDKNGNYIGETYNNKKDGFGHAQLGGVGQVLGSLIQDNIEKRVKVVEFGILQRCAAHFASQTDINESILAGKMAVKHALDGDSGFMVGFERSTDESGQYLCKTTLVPLSKVANQEKLFPRDWINESGNYILNEGIEYIRPLIIGEPKLPTKNGLPRFIHLKKNFISKKEL